MNRRYLDLPLEVKAQADGRFSGLAAAFGNVDLGGDVIEKGAFSATLQEWKGRRTLPPLLWGHDPTEPIGVLDALDEDEAGLAVKGRVLAGAGPVEQRALEHMKAGSLRGLSVGYSLGPDGASYDTRARVRRLKTINLHEVSLVALAMNPRAMVTDVKSALDGGPKSFEHFLRDAGGLSRTEAKRLVSGGWNLYAERDADDEDEEREAFIEAVRFHVQRIGGVQ